MLNKHVPIISKVGKRGEGGAIDNTKFKEIKAYSVPPAPHEMQTESFYTRHFPLETVSSQRLGEARGQQQSGHPNSARTLGLAYAGPKKKKNLFKMELFRDVVIKVIEPYHKTSGERSCAWRCFHLIALYWGPSLSIPLNEG